MTARYSFNTKHTWLPVINKRFVCYFTINLSPHMNKPPLFSALPGVVPLLALACCKTAKEKVTEVKGGVVMASPRSLTLLQSGKG